MTQIAPFQIQFPREALDDLRDRLDRARWPSAIPDIGWTRGVPPDYLRHLVEYWRDEYDWSAWQARLNTFPQFTTEIDGQPIHFLHVRSPEPDAVPLIITHGWPGSVVEFLDVLGPLTDPRAHGGTAGDAFHVVAPSLPGFGFSTPVEEPGWGHRRIARAWAELMRRLGYRRYGAHGGDTGSIVSPELARVVPERVIGVHICGGLAYPTGEPEDFVGLSPAERQRIEAAGRLRWDGTGYADIQSTRPQTIGYGLHDSPVGQLAWIVEKFQAWTDPAQVLPEQAVDLDQLLTNVTLYWLTGTGASSAHLYYEVRNEAKVTVEPGDVPTGVAVFPTDPSIRHITERDHNVVYWSEFDRGGHFAAMEAPDLLVGDIRAFFRRVRPN
ncbi:epoxide hydrolase family protein [Pseudonocardia acaciae]|uniref:epoxide hydrolase family protein n=1 Tax=Pseudonocardia acaciae TaxID=551276 RepID=UPI000490D3E1|nr:epoxide hydrolase family protein [Pseudonocardia acaciae]